VKGISYLEFSIASILAKFKFQVLNTNNESRKLIIVKT
jgi:hypothetical protein